MQREQHCDVLFPFLCVCVCVCVWDRSVSWISSTDCKTLPRVFSLSLLVYVRSVGQVRWVCVLMYLLVSLLLTHDLKINARIHLVFTVCFLFSEYLCKNNEEQRTNDPTLLAFSLSLHLLYAFVSRLFCAHMRARFLIYTLSSVFL